MDEMHESPIFYAIALAGMFCEDKWKKRNIIINYRRKNLVEC